MAKKDNKKSATADGRITLKFDREFWDIVSDEIEKHPEWGVRSVPDFVRRAVDNELNARKRISERKVIRIDLRSRDSEEGNPDKYP